MTTRRQAVVALPALTAASFAIAQRPRTASPKRIGIFNLGPGPERSDPGKPVNDEGTIWDELSKKGWMLGENLFVERVYAGWRTERLAELASELVRRRVDMIISNEEQAVVASARATKSIPILFLNQFLPVEQGFVDSLAHPGRNLTGFVQYSSTNVASKRLEFLKAVAPAAKRLSWITGGDTWFVETVAGGRLDISKIFESACTGLGLDVKFHLLPAPADLDRVFEEIVAWKAQAITAGGNQVFEVRDRLCSLALRQRIPLVGFPALSRTGALLSYGVSASEGQEVFQRWLEYVSRVLRGASPADLPVIQPSRYELVINLKTAKALGLTIPEALLARADELIQ